MKMYHHPDYKDLLQMRLTGLDDPEAANEFEKIRAYLMTFKKPENLIVENKSVKSLYEDHDIDIRIYKNKDTVKRVPLILNIHGGGFIAGSLDNDDKRCANIVERLECVIVSVGYRLAPDCVYPGQLQDCYSVLKWSIEHADELRIDANNYAIQGISAGGNLAAGLTLYLRDKNEVLPAMTVLNIPLLNLEQTYSREQMKGNTPVLSGDGLLKNHSLYLGGLNGTQPSYYTVPLTCPSLQDLPPHFIICAEYDPLRDEAILYAQKLLNEGVPTELYVLPRVPHGYDMVIDANMTQWIYDGICASYKREFEKGE